MKLTFRERLFSRLIIDPDTGCLLWTGHKTHDGYGLISIHGTNRVVHRVMYNLFAEPIPDGLELDHLCTVRHCASVPHLEPVNHWTNLLRGTTPSALNARKTHCKHGHPFDLLNTYWTPQGHRQCRTCLRSRTRKQVSA